MTFTLTEVAIIFIVIILLLVLLFIAWSQHKERESIISLIESQLSSVDKHTPDKEINVNLNRNTFPEPPLKNSTGVPINTKTRGETSYQQIGILSNETNDKILPLYGKQTYQSSNKWQYYTTNDGFNLITLPIAYKNRDCTSEYGCDELYNDDTVVIDQYNQSFKVKIYENKDLRYIPL